MSLVKTRLALLATSENSVKHLAAFEPITLDLLSEDFVDLEIEILILELNAVSKITYFKELAAARMAGKIKKVVLLANDEAGSISTSLYNSLSPDVVSLAVNLKSEDLFELSSDIQQTSQNNVYVNLSNELNSEYEKIKLELEEKLNSKARNLVESRQKVFEINSRVEFLRKTLYTISEIKTIGMAEEKLNELLTSYTKVTWFRIVPAEKSEPFEHDIGMQFESALFKSEVQVKNEHWFLYFFKGDKKPFKKNDIFLFKKLTETLQINLSRLDNLATLKQNENFFNLAFHSSRNPIIVLDQHYVVRQANNAAMVGSSAKNQKHCYELLFDRDSVCVGCNLGKSFQIQDKNSFFNVQSQSLSLMEDENAHFWVHVYEDSTEQNLYEKKITQFARLEELGLISSSIAHELNNPLGGILSFIQIMKMELPKQHILMNDLNMMHETALRMKKIIEDLLIFSRSNQELVLEETDIYFLTESVLGQFELQFKVEKMRISFLPPPNPVMYEVSRPLFQNSVNLILQFFLQKATIKRTIKHNFISLVEVKISQDQMNHYLSFSSNLGPFENEFKTKDLNLLAIEKSLTDQGFQLFINEPATDWIQLSILLPKEILA